MSDHIRGEDKTNGPHNLLHNSPWDFEKPDLPLEDSAMEALILRGLHVAGCHFNPGGAAATSGKSSRRSGALQHITLAVGAKTCSCGCR